MTCRQARSWGNAEAVDRLEVRRRLADLQRRMLAELEDPNLNPETKTNL